jgi:antitoxin (DNA-binding transcriptional repressor) of toxin-antitoxin stability system
MISVGVRELKNQLSQYLQYVKKGERVLITEHNRIIAELSLPKDQKDLEVESLLEGLAALGKLQKAKRNKTTASSRSTGKKLEWVSIYQDNRSK